MPVFPVESLDDPRIEIYRNLRSTNRTRDLGMMVAESDRVVGCHMMGTDAAEIIQGLGVALKCGATKAQFDATAGIHPTAAEEFVTMRKKLPALTARKAG